MIYKKLKTSNKFQKHDALHFKVEKISFLKRCVFQIGWILVLLACINIFAYYNDGILGFAISFGLSIPIILYFIISVFYSEKYLLLELELDNNSVFIKANKFDSIFLEKSFSKDELKLECKKVFSGIGGNPIYQLKIKKQGRTLLKQNSHLIWSSKHLREITKEFNENI